MSSENLPDITSEARGATAIMAPSVHYGMPEDVSMPGSDNPSASAYRFIHNALRGRYLAVIVTGIALGSLLGAAGWMCSDVSYKSEALLRISYDIPRVSSQSPEFRPVEVFEAFMQSQQALIASARVVGKALQDAAWTKQGYKNMSKQSPDGFASDLKVEHKAGTEHMKIGYSSSDPVFAALSVQTVVNAYLGIYDSLDQKTSKEKTTVLETRREDLKKQIATVQTALRSESAEFGSSNIEKFYDAAVQRLTRVESALMDVRISLALAEGAGAGVPVKFSVQQIARGDATMARYMAEREDVENELSQLRLRGYGEGHSQIVQAKKRLDTIGKRIQDYAMDYQASTGPASVSPNMQQVNQPGLAGRTAEELKADEVNLFRLNRDSKEQMATLGGKKLRFDGMQAEVTHLQVEMADVSAKLSTLQLESGLSGRLSVMSSAEVPLQPYRDRRAIIAAAGSGVGLFLPALLMLASSSISRRYRYSGDAVDEYSSSIRLLGILPQLPPRLTDPDSAADAAQCVHQIRVMLQVHANGNGSMAYHVTSACAGEGKTSLVASLALSYAAAGQKTLVVDADMIGQRLTRGYGLEDQPGFREAIGKAWNNGVIFYDSGVANLSVLPAGISDGRDACAISAGTVRRLLVGLRKQFDVILIDSGPILGSLEALVVAQVSDGVILTISREQQKPVVDRAVRQLKSVGAQIAGMVFNKAERVDFRRSVGAMSLRSIPRTSSDSLVKAGVTSTSGFGSLVDSVQTYLPSAS